MKKRNVFILFTVLLLALVGCGNETTTGGNSDGSSDSSERAEPSTLERAQNDGFITVGFANEIPYAYATADGQLTGQSVEVARAVLKRLDIEEMDGVVTEFGSLIPGLQAGRFDVITAGMYITPTRCQEVAFGEPEYSIGEGLAVVTGNPLNLTSYEDIAANPDATIAIMAGAIEFDYVTAIGVEESQIQIVPDNPSAVASLQANRVDAITMTGPSLQAMLDSANDSNIERVMEFTQPVIDGESIRGYGGAAFRKADTDFVEAYNQELQALKDSGELLEIISEFGFTEQELPGDMTATQLCGQ